MDKMKFDEITWQEFDDDDFTAYLGDYTLRVEQMSKHHWWFCVYHKDERIFINYESAYRKGHAQELAILYCKAHYYENK